RRAGDAEEAVSARDTFHPRLILVDLQMPGMDGFELTRQLKADPARSSIIIVALTAYAMRGDEEKCLAAGCDGYLAKPIDTRTLASIVADYIAGRGGTPAA